MGRKVLYMPPEDCQVIWGIDATAQWFMDRGAPLGSSSHSPDSLPNGGRMWLRTDDGVPREARVEHADVEL